MSPAGDIATRSISGAVQRAVDNIMALDNPYVRVAKVVRERRFSRNPRPTNQAIFRRYFILNRTP